MAVCDVRLPEQLDMQNTAASCQKHTRTHRVVLHMVKAPLPVEHDRDGSAHWKRHRYGVHDGAAGISLHVQDADGCAVLTCERAAVGWLAAT
jgi:hypothetical protein